MKTYKVELTEGFIKEAHAVACPDWKTKIKDLVPEAFESTVGKWTICRINGYENSLVFDTGNKDNYGLIDGIWEHDLKVYDDLATDKEVKEALIKEAKKRGFKNVDLLKIKTLNGSTYPAGYFTRGSNNFTYHNNKLSLDGVCIYSSGTWAEPIETPTLKRIEEIEAELKQLKEKL